MAHDISKSTAIVDVLVFESIDGFSTMIGRSLVFYVHIRAAYDMRLHLEVVSRSVGGEDGPKEVA